jgi:hypothetical protein
VAVVVADAVVPALDAPNKLGVVVGAVVVGAALVAPRPAFRGAAVVVAVEVPTVAAGEPPRPANKDAGAAGVVLEAPGPEANSDPADDVAGAGAVIAGAAAADDAVPGDVAG